MSISPRAAERHAAGIRLIEMGFAVEPAFGIVETYDGDLICECSAGRACGSHSGKHPRRRGWETAPKYTKWMLDRELRRHPHANLTIRTGRPSRVVVLDVDGQRGRDQWPLLLDAAGLTQAEVDTFNVTTGRDDGGEHNYYALPPGVVVANGHPVLPDGTVLDAIDVKGEDGLVVAPGSRHYTGREYVADGTPMKMLPASMLPMLPSKDISRPVASAQRLRRTEAEWCRAGVVSQLEWLREQVAGRELAVFRSATKVGELAHGLAPDEYQAALNDVLTAAHDIGAVRKHGLAAITSKIERGAKRGELRQRHAKTAQRCYLGELRENVTTAPWRGPSARTDRDVLEVVIEIAERYVDDPTGEFTATTRLISDLSSTGLNPMTATRALKRLTAAGWLVKGSERSAWRFGRGPSGQEATNTPTTPPPSGEFCRSVTESPDQWFLHGHDLFSSGGLRREGELVAWALHGGSSTPKDIVAKLDAIGEPLSDRTIRRRLRDLVDYETAEKLGKGKFVSKLTEDTADAAARALGVAGSRSRKRTWHAIQRDAFRAMEQAQAGRPQADQPPIEVYDDAADISDDWGDWQATEWVPPTQEAVVSRIESQAAPLRPEARRKLSEWHRQAEKTA